MKLLLLESRLFILINGDRFSRGHKGDNMKKLALILAVISLMIIKSSLIKCSIGCMDNSYHTNKDVDGYDYKQYEPVYCACGCERYPMRADRGQCSECEHYRIP